MPAQRSPGRPLAPLLDIARYPSQRACLSTLAALSIGMPLTMLPAVGYVVQLVIWAAAYHYAVEVLQHSANGTASAPEFTPEQDGIGWRLLWLQLAFALAAWLLHVAVYEPLPRLLGLSLLAVLQPAMTLTAAMERRLASGLNLALVLRVISALSAVYAWLVVAGLGMGLIEQYASSIFSGARAYLMTMSSAIGLGGRTQIAGLLAGNGLLAVLGDVLAAFVWSYALVAYFRAMGQAIHARADALGFTPQPRRALRPEDHHAPLLQRVEDLAARHDHAAAAALLGECLATQPYASAQMHARYRELLQLSGDTAAALAHARMRIDALLAAGSGREAIALAREALALDPDFRPSSAQRTTELAQAAETLGQPSLALTLLSDFTARYPFDAAIPDNALAAARLLEQRHCDLPAALTALQAALDCMLPAHPQYAALLAERERIAMQARTQ